MENLEQWAEKRGPLIAITEAGELVRSHLASSSKMRVVITGECRELKPLMSGWTMELAVPVDRAVVSIPVQFDRPTTDAVRKYLYRHTQRNFLQHFTVGAGVTIAGDLTYHPATHRLVLQARQAQPEKTIQGPVSAAEKLHITALQQLTHRGDIPKGSWPEKLERVTVLSPDNSKAVTDIQAVIENKGKGTIQLPKFTHVPVSMNRHTVAEKLVKALAAIDQGSADLILITRGGGHWTDLWSFNDPELARAIHQCPVPVMVAIGHAADHTSNAERLAVDHFSTPTAFGHELVRKLYARNGARKPRAATVPASTSQTASTQTQLDAQRERCRELEQMNAVNSSHAKEWRSAFLNELHASGTARVKNHWATVALIATLAGVIAAMIATAKSEDLTAPTVILVATAVITALCWRHRRQADAPPRPTRTRAVPVDAIEWINAARKARTPRRHRAVWAQVPATLTNP